MYYVLSLLILLAMLFTSSCFVGSSLLFLESETTDKPNLVYNPGFEMGPAQEKWMPSGWVLIDSPRELVEPIACDSSRALEGSNSLRIEKSNKHQMIVSDAFPINPQSGYFIKASAASTALRGPKLKLRFITYNNSGKIRNRFSTSIRSEQDWKKSSISAGFLKNDAVFGRVVLLVPPTGEETVWIDGVGCYRVHYFPVD
jgi:hypothetical protein